MDRRTALIAAASVSAPLTVANADDAVTADEGTHARIEGAVDFAKDLTSNATAVLTDSSIDDAQKLENFRIILAEGLALETIGKFMIGEARKTMTAEQTERYNKIFPLYITKLYAEQFEEIVGKPLAVIDAKEYGARDVIVRTEFERKDAAAITVDWRVRQLRSGERKALDIIVSGVSIMLVNFTLQGFKI